MTDFAYKPTLTGELVVLRPLDEGDYDALKVAMDDPDVARLTGSRGEIGEEEARKWCRTRKEQTDRLDLAIVDKATGETVGEAVLNEWSPDDESCNFRILIGAGRPGPRARHRGDPADRRLRHRGARAAPDRASACTPSIRGPSGPTRRPASWSRASGGTR